MTIFERLDYAKKVWGLVLPAVDTPPDHTFVMWLSKSTDDEVERAILRTPDRIKNWDKNFGTLNAIEVHKYVTSSLSNMRKARGRAGSHETVSERK